MATRQNIRPVGMHLGAVTAAIADQTFGVVHESGANVHLKALTGWYDVPVIDGEMTQRAGAPGADLTPSWVGGRAIGVTVAIDGFDEAHTGDLVDDLTAALPTSELVPFTVTDPRRELTALARIAPGTGVVVNRSGIRGGVAFTLAAPDPRRYATDEQTVTTGRPTTSGGLSLPLSLPLSVAAVVTSGRVTAVNAGKTGSPPLITLTGPLTGPMSVTNLTTGQQLTFNDSIAAGRTLVIDCGEHTALLDGTASRTVLGQWLELVPGPNALRFDAASGSGQMTVSYRSAWR